MRFSLVTTVILLAGSALAPAVAEPLASPTGAASLAVASSGMATCHGDRPKISVRMDRDRAAKRRFCPRNVVLASCPVDPLVTLAWSDPAYSSRLLAMTAARD